jgi:hypothetical protein
MSGTPDWDDAWQGLEPQQPRTRRGCYGWALAAAVVLTLAVLALAVFARQQGTSNDSGLLLPGTDPAETAAPGETTDPGQATAAPGEATATVSGLAPTATLPGDAATPALPPASDVVAGRFAPILDGDPSDWANLPFFTSPYAVFTGDEWDGSDDLAPTWWGAWDDVYLYFAFSVVDDIHAQNQSGNSTFRGDSLELQIDTDRAGDFGPTLSADDFQISLSPGDFGALPPSAWLFQGTSGGDMLDAPAGHTIVVAARPAADGYTLEAAIPWVDLRLTPTAGLVIGLAVNANDNDRRGEAVQEMMKSNVPGRRFGDPTTWGTLTLQ